MTYEARVFAVLKSDEWTMQGDVISRARMAPERAIRALEELTHIGAVEWSKLFRGRGNGSGRPAYIYWRRSTQEAA